MAKYRCTTKDCGRQMTTKPASGYKCPNCLSTDSYVEVKARNKKKKE